MMSPRILPVLLLAVAALAAIVLLHADRSPPTSFLTAQAVQPLALGEFELVDHGGRPFTPEELRGRWTLLFIGFSHCPDVCPNTLWQLGRVESRVLEAGGRIATVFVSVDPERDTPETLARYVGYFSPHLRGVTGTSDELNRFTANLGLGYVKIPVGADAYTIEHSAALALVDPRARVTAYVRPPLDVEALAEDLLAATGRTVPRR